MSISKTEMHAQRSNPKLLPLKYSRDYPPTCEWVEKYYNEYFWKDLYVAYQIDKMEEYSYSMLTIFKDNKVGEMPIVWNGINHFHMFSQGIFFMSLCQQIVNKLYGWNAMEKFMATSSWPMISCFMAGLRHPIYIIQYAELFHLEGLEEAYCSLLDISLQYFTDWMSEHLDNTDYNIQDIVCEMSEQVKIFNEWIRDPNTQYPSIYAEELVQN